MENKLVLKLIKAHTEKNDKEFEKVAFEIAKIFEEEGNSDLSAYVTSLLYPSGNFIPM